MADTAHLWAVGYDDISRASAVRDEVTKLAWGPGQGGKYLILLDTAVVIRHPDGSFTLDRNPFPGIGNILSCSAAGFSRRSGACGTVDGCDNRRLRWRGRHPRLGCRIRDQRRFHSGC